MYQKNMRSIEQAIKEVYQDTPSEQSGATQDILNTRMNRLFSNSASPVRESQYCRRQKLKRDRSKDSKLSKNSLTRKLKAI